METMRLLQIERTYKIDGQHAEQVARFTLTGKIEKADHKPFWMGGDCGDIQIKSARASICRGTDIRAHVAIDPAQRYGYVIKDFSLMYIMNKTEYIEFCETFGTVTKDSAKNGGHEKTRLKAEGREMAEWFRSRI